MLQNKNILVLYIYTYKLKYNTLMISWEKGKYFILPFIPLLPEAVVKWLKFASFAFTIIVCFESIVLNTWSSSTLGIGAANCPLGKLKGFQTILNLLSQWMWTAESQGIQMEVPEYDVYLRLICFYLYEDYICIIKTQQ